LTLTHYTTLTRVGFKDIRLALSKEVLGNIRGKYQTLPGPGGGARLNGAELSQQAQQEKQTLIEELLTEIEAPPLFDIF
jgi:hypothetical protein